MRGWRRSPRCRRRSAAAWDAIAKATLTEEKLERETTWIRSENKYYSELFGIARNLVQGVAEKQKPDVERYREFTDARLPATELVTFSKAPIYPELEVELLTLGLTKMREELGADYPYVRKVLEKESPRQLATKIVQGTKLYDVAVRRSLWSGGPEAVAAVDRPDDRLRAQAGRRHAPGAQGLRGPGRGGGAEELRAHRQGAVPAEGTSRTRTRRSPPGCPTARCRAGPARTASR